ncbi:hypothetical protein GOFOIKOB_4530 [Methylobacterium tardum]|uniref:Uncharacterized protein n=1 Tax=Methylobacterium tardum TaxID=374432 RepID=A0AA37WUK8_9HYPH|nr:hypothetical protein [Methylobacterium tardum]GJE51471.1 hypothetical protein GOFOIKOB_4530 [Methylobacterium tardum]GLS73631.1 hypothetical protein GCM10007890_56460 [Methylobacterium tardum]
MTRALYTISPERQRAFRSAVVAVRDDRADDVILDAWEILSIGRATIDSTATLDVYAIAEERMAVLPAGERAKVEAALLGGPA